MGDRGCGRCARAPALVGLADRQERRGAEGMSFCGDPGTHDRGLYRTAPH